MRRRGAVRCAEPDADTKYLAIIIPHLAPEYKTFGRQTFPKSARKKQSLCIAKQKSPPRKTDFFAHEAGYRLCGAGLTAEKENSRRRGRRRPISQKQEEKDFTVAGLVPCCNYIVTLLSPNCNTFLSLFCNFFCELFVASPCPAVQNRQNSSKAALPSRRPVTYQPGAPSSPAAWP